MRIIALRLSCVATAIALPHIFRYHHTPANRAAHVSSSAGAKDPTIMAVEELLSLGECFKPDKALETAQEAKAKRWRGLQQGESNFELSSRTPDTSITN